MERDFMQRTTTTPIQDSKHNEKGTRSSTIRQRPSGMLAAQGFIQDRRIVAMLDARACFNLTSGS